MKTNKTVWVALVVVAIIAIFALARGSQVQTVIKQGSIPGNSVDGTQWSVNGFQQIHIRQPFSRATTTPCNIQTPNATTTPLMFTVNMTTASDTASLLTLATSSSITATSSNVWGSQIGVPANGKTGFVASSTAQTAGLTAISGFGILPPNTWIVLGMQGNPGTYSPVGSCQVELRVL